MQQHPNSYRSTLPQTHHLMAEHMHHPVQHHLQQHGSGIPSPSMSPVPSPANSYQSLNSAYSYHTAPTSAATSTGRSAGPPSPAYPEVAVPRGVDGEPSGNDYDDGNIGALEALLVKLQTLRMIALAVLWMPTSTGLPLLVRTKQVRRWDRERLSFRSCCICLAMIGKQRFLFLLA